MVCNFNGQVNKLLLLRKLELLLKLLLLKLLLVKLLLVGQLLLVKCLGVGLGLVNWLVLRLFIGMFWIILMIFCGWLWWNMLVSRLVISILLVILVVVCSVLLRKLLVCEGVVVVVGVIFGCMLLVVVVGLEKCVLFQFVGCFDWFGVGLLCVLLLNRLERKLLLFGWFCCNWVICVLSFFICWLRCFSVVFWISIICVMQYGVVGCCIRCWLICVLVLVLCGVDCFLVLCRWLNRLLIRVFLLDFIVCFDCILRRKDGLY